MQRSISTDLKSITIDEALKEVKIKLPEIKANLRLVKLEDALKKQAMIESPVR